MVKLLLKPILERVRLLRPVLPLKTKQLFGQWWILKIGAGALKASMFWTQRIAILSYCKIEIKNLFCLDRAFLTVYDVYQSFILGTYKWYQSEAMLLSYMTVIRRTVGIIHRKCTIPDH